MDTVIQSGAPWYLGRATGVVSLVLLTAVVLLGILGNRGVRLPGLPRFATTGLHRNLSLMAVAFLAVHVVSVVVDPFVTIRWIDALVPGTSAYRPWVGLGALALDLIAALVITSLARVRMGRRSWRATHWLAYAAWPAALVHGLGIGTDLGSGWYLALSLCLAGLVAGAAGWRMALADAELPRAARAARLLLATAPVRGPRTGARETHTTTTGHRR